MSDFDQNSMTPLVVDLDGTLTRTDTLHECLVILAKQSPLALLQLPFVLLGGKAKFKEFIAARVNINPAQIPYREELIDYLKQEKCRGRQLILATAAHTSIAEKVAEHLQLFDRVLASDLNNNLKGVQKLQAIHRVVGEDFAYAGDSKADIPIWNAASSAILVDVTAPIAAEVRSVTRIEREFSAQRISLNVWLKALRVHQWLKNVLLFVPLLTAFSFLEIDKTLTVLTAFLAFSIAASGTYVLNDIWDLESDRQHPRKRNRPFASCQIPIRQGVSVAVLALAFALAVSFFVSPRFLLMLLLYIGLTSAYSWKLKAYVLIDVIMLSLLYTLRILAGSVATAIPTSSWLLAFSVFIFLSLALVKRCTELVSLRDENRSSSRGRDYRVADLSVLWPMGVGSALSAVVIFGLFISAPDTQTRYATPQLLWLVAVGLTYWLGRLWLKTSRGEMHDDPIVYAIKDYGSRVSVIAMFAIMLIARSCQLDTVP